MKNLKVCQKKIARIISALSDPIVLLSAFVITIIYLLVPEDKILLIILQLILLLIAQIIITRLILLQRGKISNWDISIRKQRTIPFIAMVILLIINLFIIKTYNISVLYDIFRIFIFWMIGFLILTTLIKLSGHVGVISLVIGIFVIFSDFLLWPLFIFIPIVAWSRIVLKRHTLPETVVGAFYSLAILIVIYSFNLLNFS